MSVAGSRAVLALAGLVLCFAGCGGDGGSSPSGQTDASRSGPAPGRQPLYRAVRTVQDFVAVTDSRPCRLWSSRAATQRQCREQTRQVAGVRRRHRRLLAQLRYRPTEIHDDPARVSVVVASPDAQPGVPSILPRVFRVVHGADGWRIAAVRGPAWAPVH